MEAADVHRLDRAVGAAELLEHPLDGVGGLGQAVALLRQHAPGLAAEHLLAHGVLAVLVGGPLEQAGVEPLGEEDQVLAPFHQRHLAGEVGERAGEGLHLRLEGRAVGLLDAPRQRLEGSQDRGIGDVGQGIAGEGASAAGDAPRAQHLLQDEAERIDRMDQVGEAERGEGVLDLPPVGGVAEHELRTAQGAVGCHGHQVGPLELVEEAGRRPPRPHHRFGLGEGEVEEEEEVAPGRRRHLRGLAAGRREVEHLEAGDRQPAPPLPDLEIAGLEAADRLAVAHHLHRHLDRQHLGGAGEGGPGRRRGRGLPPRRHRGHRRHRGPEAEERGGEAAAPDRTPGRHRRQRPPRAPGAPPTAKGAVLLSALPAPSVSVTRSE